MIEKQGKIWGSTALIFRNPFVQTHLLEICAGGYCSEHRHSRKTNHFFVISGRIRVLIWKDGGAPDVTELSEGQSTGIPPGVFHQFQGIEKSVVLEIYESASIEEDIERRTTGGAKG